MSRATEQRRQAKEKQGRWSEVLNLVGLCLALGSWGYSVISPEPNYWLGSTLLLGSFLAMALAACRALELRKSGAAVVTLLVMFVFVLFDWRIVVKPQRGKAFKELLVKGYNIRSECEGLVGASPEPAWMRDQSKEWQAQVGQLISEKLDYKDSQTWHGAIIVGRVADESTVAYQCTWLTNKVTALETIIATNFDSKLQHSGYNGPTYWFDAVNGKVDIGDAFKNGNSTAHVYLNGGGKTKDGKVEVEGHGITQLVKP